jgi:predicted anti-sigma-YlaC factor YlaD
MNCTTFREHLDAYLEESLEDDHRKAVRSHLASCDGCRRWALEQDPTLLFAFPAATSPVPDDVEACVAAVTAQIRHHRLERRTGSGRRPWLAAAAAMILLVAGAIVWQGMEHGSAKAPSAGSAVAEAVVKDSPPPRVEVDMPESGVRVYQHAEAGSDDAAVYFVVNPALDS